MSCGSSPKRGGGTMDHYWLLRRNPLKAKGRQVALFYKASPVLLTRHQCSFTGIPTHSIRRLSRPTRASSAQSRTLFDSNTRPAGPTSGRTTFTISRGLLWWTYQGYCASGTASPAILRVAKSVEFNAYVTCSHDQIYLRSRQLHLPIGRIYNNCASGIYIKL
jgi:hypothetical protein